MQLAYNILLVLGLIVAFVFGGLVLLTGKGDAMSGSSGVRTSFKGKASFDDLMSRIILIFGTSFMLLVFIIDIVSNRVPAH